MLSNTYGELLKLVDVPKQPDVVNPIKPVLHGVIRLLATGDNVSGLELADVQKAVLSLISCGLHGRTLAWMLFQW